jgi:hypothetical protein
MTDEDSQVSSDDGKEDTSWVVGVFALAMTLAAVGLLLAPVPFWVKPLLLALCVMVSLVFALIVKALFDK